MFVWLNCTGNPVPPFSAAGDEIDTVDGEDKYTIGVSLVGSDGNDTHSLLSQSGNSSLKHWKSAGALALI